MRKIDIFFGIWAIWYFLIKMSRTVVFCKPTFHITVNIPDIPHPKHPTSPAPHISNIPYPKHLTFSNFQTANIPQPHHPTSQTSKMPNISCVDHPTLQTSHIPNIPYPKHPLFRTSHILNIPHHKQIDYNVILVFIWLLLRNLNFIVNFIKFLN